MSLSIEAGMTKKEGRRGQTARLESPEGEKERGLDISLKKKGVEALIVFCLLM